jgi:hypothetical protein
VGDYCPGSPAFFGTDKDKVLRLAIASAVVLAVSVGFRIFSAMLQIWRGRRDLEGPSDVLQVLAGFVVALVDPWNGSLFINEVMSECI